jgi:aryl-alcohol dehydrogenase-like predicted oxidoreductase
VKYQFMGKTGLRVSELCLGTMTFGAAADRDESFRIMDRYKEASGNFIDTANVIHAVSRRKLSAVGCRNKRGMNL